VLGEGGILTQHGDTKVNEQQISSLIYSRFFSSNATFFTPLTQVKLESRLALLHVDRNVEKVDQDKGNGRPKRSTKDFIDFF
jgi:hypothetical protein